LITVLLWRLNAGNEFNRAAEMTSAAMILGMMQEASTELTASAERIKRRKHGRVAMAAFLALYVQPVGEAFTRAVGGAKRTHDVMLSALCAQPLGKNYTRAAGDAKHTAAGYARPSRS